MNAQHSTAQHSTAQHSTAQHSGVTERTQADRPRISACIITFNEADNLAACLASLDFCDEIVVVDSFSTDETVAIAQAAGARVIQREFTGYRNQKDFCVQQARHDWILSLDADERLDDTLKQSIIWARDQGFPDSAGYRFTRITHCYGKFLRNPSPDRPIRLFDRRCGGFRGTREVHEGVSSDGSIGLLDGKLLHYTYRSFLHWTAKRQQYARMLADHHFSIGKRAIPARMLWKLWLDPLWFSFRHLVLKGGFLDGWAGLIHVAVECNYRRQIIIMLWLRQQGLE